MADSVIIADNLVKSFKSTEVLKGVSFQVRRGEIYALLGSNGAGKTTTINILSTLLRPDSGSASVCGYSVGRQPEKVRENISLTGQFAAVDSVLTGRENLIMIARLRGIKDPNQTAGSLLERFGLGEAADRRAATYSGGIARKLDIAMSLVGAPAVIFLDEPTTGLDPEARLEVWKTVRALADGGTTILLTTQHLEEAQALADEIAILLMSIASGISYTAVRLFADVQNGLFQRFHSMPVPRSAVLWAHVLTSLVSNVISVALIIAAALLMGFRSSASLVQWLAVAGILAFFTLALTWVAVIPGLSAKSVDGASAFSYPIMFLPFISSAFVPTGTMPAGVRAFAENQPVTSIVNAIRALLYSQPVGSYLWVALAWCAGITAVACVLALRVYRRIP